jgi:hypothetical protein
MKKLLIGTALAGALVGSFASFSSAAPLPTPLDAKGSANIVDVAGRCGPYHHYVHGFHDHHGHWIAGHCVLTHH